MQRIIDKFTLLVDLGIVVVPSNYFHGTCLDSFARRYRHEFIEYDDEITDASFGSTTVRLRPNQKLRVRAFKQTTSDATPLEHLAFLATQKALLIGIQGLTLVFEQKFQELPQESHLYASYGQGIRKEKAVAFLDLYHGYCRFLVHSFEDSWTLSPYVDGSKPCVFLFSEDRNL